MLAPLTAAPASSSSRWPTPMARDGSGRGVGSPAFLLQRLVRGRGVMLDEAVRAEQLWPTLDAVKWPTPTAGAVRGPLNPAWLESLMGFPVGWTAIDGPQDADTSSTPGNPPGP